MSSSLSAASERDISHLKLGPKQFDDVRRQRFDAVDNGLGIVRRLVHKLLDVPPVCVAVGGRDVYETLEGGEIREQKKSGDIRGIFTCKCFMSSQSSRTRRVP